MRFCLRQRIALAIIWYPQNGVRTVARSQALKFHADGSLLCPRCKRRATGWPLKRGDLCSPKNWVNCLRNPETIVAKLAAKEAAANVSL